MTPLVLELLAWIAAKPRSYGETMAAWRSSCPQASVWEDATSAGLVEVVSGGNGLDAAVVRLDARGSGGAGKRPGLRDVTQVRCIAGPRRSTRAPCAP